MHMNAHPSRQCAEAAKMLTHST